MILGIDHVTVTPNGVSDIEERLQQLDYELHVTETAFANPKIKQPFLTKWTDTHAIHLFRHGKSPAIELVDHGSTSGDYGPFTPVFADRGVDTPATPSNPCTESLGVPAINTTGDHDQTTLVGLLLRSGDPDASSRFWQTLGFAPAMPGEPDYGLGSHLVLRAPLTPNPFRLWIHPSSQTRTEPMLDDQGVPCLCLITTKIEQIEPKLDLSGASWTDPADIHVGDRALSIQFIRAPTGELVELIEVRSDGR